MPGLRTFARVDGHLLRVSQGDGRPDPPDHGFGRQHRDVGPAGARAPRPGFQTIAYDAPERTRHRSSRCGPRLARQAVHLLDTLGLPDAHVLGVSSGAASPRAGPAQPPPSPPADPGLHVVRARRRPLAPRWRSACSPRRCATTRPASCRRPHAGCTARSPIPTAGSCTSRSTLAGQPTSTMWGYLTATHAGWTSLPWLQRIAAPTLVVTGGKDPIIVPPVNARILDPGLGATSTSCPTPGTCCSWTTPSSART